MFASWIRVETNTLSKWKVGHNDWLSWIQIRHIVAWDAGQILSTVQSFAGTVLARDEGQIDAKNSAREHHRKCNIELHLEVDFKHKVKPYEEYSVPYWAVWTNWRNIVELLSDLELFISHLPWILRGMPSSVSLFWVPGLPFLLPHPVLPPLLCNEMINQFPSSVKLMTTHRQDYTSTLDFSRMDSAGYSFGRTNHHTAFVCSGWSTIGFDTLTPKSLGFLNYKSLPDFMVTLFSHQPLEGVVKSRCR